MPTYKCRTCGNEIVLSTKPGQCEICGASQFKVVGQRNSNSVSGNVNPNSSSSFLNNSKIPSSSLNPSSGRISKSNLSTGQKSSQPTINNTSFIVPPTTKPRKTYPQPSLPLYSSSSQSSTPHQKIYPQSTSKEKKFNKRLKIIIPILLGFTGMIGYWLWQLQYDTSEFKKVVFQETFKSSKNWSLTNGSVIKKGSLFQQQPIPNHYGASIWTRKIFTDIDFSSDVTKIKGSDENPLGVIARVNGKSSENFYYLLINGKGEFVLGKHFKESWIPKVGWKKNRAVNSGNAKNNLRIVCKDDLIIGFINGQRVGSFRDPSFTSGKVAVFSMRGKGEAASIYFDNAIAKERIKQSTQQNQANTSPQKAIQNYYTTRVNNKENEPLGDLVKKVDIYGIKTLKTSPTSAQIKVWLKYQMENGLTVCESRIFNLTKGQKDKEWNIQDSEKATQQPSCHLST